MDTPEWIIPLDPHKKYLIIFKGREMSSAEVSRLHQAIKAFGIDNLTIAVSDPIDITIIETQGVSNG